jgi:hypothetical protein
MAPTRLPPSSERKTYNAPLPPTPTSREQQPLPPPPPTPTTQQHQQQYDDHEYVETEPVFSQQQQQVLGSTGKITTATRFVIYFLYSGLSITRTVEKSLYTDLWINLFL